MIKLIIKDQQYCLTERNEDWLLYKLRWRYKPDDRVKIVIDGKEEEDILLSDLINF